MKTGPYESLCILIFQCVHMRQKLGITRSGGNLNGHPF